MLDEADRLLDETILPDLETILEGAAPRQMLTSLILLAFVFGVCTDHSQSVSDQTMHRAELCLRCCLLSASWCLICMRLSLQLQHPPHGARR